MKDLELDLDLDKNLAIQEHVIGEMYNINKNNIVIGYNTLDIVPSNPFCNDELIQRVGFLKLLPQNVKTVDTEYIKDAIRHTTTYDIIQKMKYILRQMRYQYDEITDDDRISFNLKENLISNLHNYWENISEQEERSTLMAILVRSIENISPSNIRDDQIDLLDNILDTINRDDIEERQTEEIFKKMIDHGLDPIGSLEGLSEIYDD